MADRHPVIIVKRKRSRRAHGHGGAWKVAYADFVTAMMAFFLVMWLVGQTKAVRAAVAGYFREPVNGEVTMRGNMEQNPQAPTVVPTERAALEKTAERIKEMLASVPELKALEKQIEIHLTREGLRIELVEGDQPTFFASGSALLAPVTDRVLTLIAQELSKLKNPVILEGHTDSRPYAGDFGYTNWELSSDRANAARRAMERALREGQVQGIRGYADTHPRVDGQPLDPRNRRVSVVVQNLWQAADLPDAVRHGAEATPASDEKIVQPSPPSPAPPPPAAAPPH